MNFSYLKDLISFCKSHIKNYHIIDEYEDNLVVIMFENKNDESRKNFYLTISSVDGIDEVRIGDMIYKLDGGNNDAKNINAIYLEIIKRCS